MTSGLAKVGLLVEVTAGRRRCGCRMAVSASAAGADHRSGGHPWCHAAGSAVKPGPGGNAPRATTRRAIMRAGRGYSSSGAVSSARLMGFFDPKHLIETFGMIGLVLIVYCESIVLARFVPVVRTLTPMLAGIGGMDGRTFTLYNVIGGGVWAIGVSVAGYFPGKTVPSIDKYLLRIIFVIVLVSVIPPVLELRRQRRSKVEDPSTCRGRGGIALSRNYPPGDVGSDSTAVSARPCGLTVRISSPSGAIRRRKRVSRTRPDTAAAPSLPCAVPTTNAYGTTSSKCATSGSTSR